jgi:hypothetical protein
LKSMLKRAGVRKMAKDTTITGDKPVVKSHAGTMVPDPVPEPSTTATTPDAIRVPADPRKMGNDGSQVRTRRGNFVVLRSKNARNPKAVFAVSQSELDECAIRKARIIRDTHEAQRIEERVAQALLAGGMVEPGPRFAELVVERAESQSEGSGTIVKLILL